jgi:hypothetical protein
MSPRVYDSVKARSMTLTTRERTSWSRPHYLPEATYLSAGRRTLSQGVQAPERRAACLS